MKAKIRRMFEVNSNMIHKIGFDHTLPGAERGYLVVQFATNHAVYGYADVEWADFLYVLNAPSVGVAFNERIRERYKSTKIGVSDTNIVDTAALGLKQQSKVSKPKEEDELPMLDVVGVDSSAGVGKVTRRKK